MSTGGEKKGTKYGKVIAIILIALVVVVAAVIGIRFAINSNHEVTDSRPVVRVMNPYRGYIKLNTEQVGTVRTGETVNVIPMMAGEILEVNFNAGDKVREGDVLVVINADGLSALKIQMDAAEISKNDAETNLERTKALYKTGAVSKAGLEQAQSAAEGAKLSYEAAKSQYDIQKKYANITAPISGTVEYKNAEVHGFASQGTPVAVISGSGNSTVIFGVNEESMNTLKVGDTVGLYKTGYQGSAEITEINSMIGQNGLFNVKAVIDNPEGLTTNSRLIVNATEKEADDALLIPLNAVYHDAGVSFVYLLQDDNTLKKTVFSAGFNDGENIVVEEGLTENDNVVYTWSRELYNGAEVLVDYNDNKEQ